MDVTYIPKAEATGRVTILPESTAFRIEVDAKGRARRVLFFDRDGREQAMEAGVVVVAGNAVETPRLLLLSASGRFPHGLANSSGLVGKNFMEHLAVFADGLLPRRVDPWRGTPTGGMIQDFYETSRSNDFARGWSIIVSSHSHWPVAVATRLSGWGVEHRRRVERTFGHSVCVASIGEQLPSLENCVSLDPIKRDAFGLPVPLLVSEPRDNDRAMIRAISASLRSLLEAAGATSISGNEYGPGLSSHYLGTCRMGASPATSVVDAWCRSHDVPNLFIADGSVFVTGGAANPALTISALAMRTAHGVVRAFKEGRL
jgi:choline dehydrogenase-like flavoprotein